MTLGFRKHARGRTGRLHTGASHPAPPRTAGRAGLRSLRVALVIAGLAVRGAQEQALGAVSVTASLDTSAVQVNEAVTLSIEISGAQDVPPPAVEVPDGLTASYLGPATQVSIVNGQVRTSVTHRYSVVALREGTYTLGPFAVAYRGQTLRTQPLDLRVTAAGTASGAAPSAGQAAAAPGFRLVLELEKSTAYVQESLPVSAVLEVGNARIDELRYPVLEAPGFAVEPFSQPLQGEEIREGQRVRTARFRTRVVPLRPGTLSLGPAQIRLSVVVTRRGRPRDPFEQFFSTDLFAERRPVELKSNTAMVEVRELPTTGRPSDFRGAVGQFDLEVSAHPNEVKAGDPITLRMRIAGPGNYATVEPPQLDGADGFKVYPPHAAASPAESERVYEQVLIPLRAGASALPAVRFSFFDPAEAKYRTLVRGPIPISVLPGESAQKPAKVEAPSRPPQQAPETLGRDIVYIKEAPGNLSVRGARLYRAPWFLAFQLLPLVLYASALWYARRRDRLHSDARYARFMRAGRCARKALGEARALLRRGAEEEFDAALARAVRDYLAAKLDLPVGAIDAARVADCLRRNGAPANATVAAERFFALLEQVRYAPSGPGAGERHEALRVAEQLVAALERQRFRDAAAATVALAAAACLARGAHAAAPQAAFYEANRLYAQGQFQVAAQRYEDVLRAGWESAELYYNLGNAYFKAGQRGLAVLSYERARRLAPRDADILANLRFARGPSGRPGDEPSLWQRLAFPLAEPLTTDALAALASAAYALAMLALSLRALRPAAARPAGHAALLLGVVWVLFAASFTWRLWHYDLARTAVVTAGDVPVRFEPSPDGTTHFVAAEGSLLTVLEEHNGWKQVARSDGRKGWVPSTAVTPIESS